MSHSAEIDALVQLSLTAFEAQVYLVLVGQPAVTAYALCRDEGWHKANTYKALESLARKGAARVLDGKHRQWLAVPAEEFLLACQLRTQRAADEVRRALRDRERPPADGRIYELRSPVAVLARAQAMLRDATTLAVVDAFPPLVEVLRADLVAAAARGVRVGLRVYEPTADLPGVRVFLAAHSDRVLADWDGQVVTLAVDANSYLVAHMDHAMTGIRQAFATSSTWLSLMASNGIAAEMIVGSLTRASLTHPEALADAAQEAVEAWAYLDSVHAPGRNSLAARPRTLPGDPSCDD
jgi:HTH-type transcriptional regulator, sugar sensing transcriptional regulator